MYLLNKLSTITSFYDKFRSKNKRIESIVYYTLSILFSVFFLSLLDFSFVDKSFEPIKIFENLILMVIPVGTAYMFTFHFPMKIRKIFLLWQEKIIKNKVDLSRRSSDHNQINSILNSKYNYLYLNFLAKAIYTSDDYSWFDIKKINLPKAWNDKEEIFSEYQMIFTEDPKINLYDSSERYYILSRICKNAFSEFEKAISKG